MSDPLNTYLHDHMAGSNFGVELLESLRDQYADEPLGEFASTLLVEVKEDRETLQQIIDRVGKSPMDLKEAAAWLGHKLSEFKLRREMAGDLGTFEVLETLELGILGKLALWRALALIADARIQGVNFQDLIARAQEQRDRVEEERLHFARLALQSSSD